MLQYLEALLYAICYIFIASGRRNGRTTINYNHENK